MAWDPALYSAFAAPRLRPALDLIGRIGAARPARVVDLGCGTGNVTRILAERWPEAAVTGIDSSPEMLAAAAKEAPALEWVKADVGAWRPNPPPDVLFSNAALHWLDDHATLFPRLLDGLAPGGWLAVQMPRNHQAPSHIAVIEAAAAGPWAEALAPVLRPSPVAAPSVYYDVLAPEASELDIWETEYLHVLEGDNPVVKWTMGTTLRPLLAALAPEQQAGFLAEYGARVAARYPKQADGKTLFPFRRVFMVARKR